MRRLVPLALLLALCACRSSDATEEGAPRLAVVASGFPKATDLQFVPGQDKVLLVLQQEGRGSWVDLQSGKSDTFLDLPVSTGSELGLLGLAFHPRFADNRRIYVNYTVRADGGNESHISEFTLPAGTPVGAATGERLLIRQVQPYTNHNAGQLQFGPDGMLYVGFGDGGSAGDPQHRAQDPGTFLGKMLRIDVDRTEGDRAYAVPADNPFVGREGFLPEIWALGLRNPWRYTFDPQGRLIVADVGQNRYEEIDLVERGDDLGWNVREGFHCFEPEKGCRSEGLVDPIFEYAHDQGQSITGGYVYTGARIPALRGRYVFTDFVSGRLWSIPLPKARERVEARSHGRTGRAVATFGRDAAGELYLADFGSGEILRLEAVP